jgi:hypothetical protein
MGCFGPDWYTGLRYGTLPLHATVYALDEHQSYTLRHWPLAYCDCNAGALGGGLWLLDCAPGAGVARIRNFTLFHDFVATTIST